MWPPNGLLEQYFAKGTSKFVYLTLGGLQKCKLEKYIIWVHGDSSSDSTKCLFSGIVSSYAGMLMLMFVQLHLIGSQAITG